MVSVPSVPAKTPSPSLPVMRLRCAARSPPTTLPSFKPLMSTPALPLPRAVVPAGLVPTKLPSMRLSSEPSVLVKKIPLRSKRLTTRPRIVTLLIPCMINPSALSPAALPSS